MASIISVSLLVISFLLTCEGINMKNIIEVVFFHLKKPIDVGSPFICYCMVYNNNNNNIHICIAPYGRNFRGAKGYQLLLLLWVQVWMSWWGSCWCCCLDALMKALVSGESGFKLLSKVLIIMLQTLLQDRIAEVAYNIWHSLLLSALLTPWKGVRLAVVFSRVAPEYHIPAWKTWHRGLVVATWIQSN